ncbi:MAG: hypothetical protein IKU00_06185 [Bacteroidales bacterium]|nr:hypothetical protein [Bacteroidales bacterium]
MDILRKNNRHLITLVIVLAVVWIGLLFSQYHLAKRAFSNQRELFQARLDDVVGESLDRIDTMDLVVIDAYLSSKLSQNGFPESYELGVFCEDSSFHYLSKGANAQSLLEEGFQYNLLTISDEEAHLDTLYIYFPDIEQRFHWDVVISYTIITLFLVLILLCFVGFVLLFQKQRKTNAFRERMVHNMAHELKTPITSIGLATQLLLDESLELEKAEEQSYVRMISDEAKTMEGLVDEALAVFRNNKLKRERQEVFIHKLLKTVTEVHRLSLNECHGEVVFDFQAQNDLVFGDVVHLANSFSNLIDNAIKYRNGDPKITISTRNVGETIEIRFADNGIGIDKSNQKLIFEPFVRINTDNEHYVKGYGLGLNYVWQIVEYHKGTIKVESELGKGTTFIMSLPLKTK